MSHEDRSSSIGGNLMAEKMRERNRLLKENYDLYMKLLTQTAEWQSALSHETQTGDGNDSINTICASTTVSDEEDLAELLKKQDRLVQENCKLYSKLLTVGPATDDSSGHAIKPSAP